MPRIKIKAIREVLAYITEEPTRLWMKSYGLTGRELRDTLTRFDQEMPPCKTACCFAGWGLFLDTPMKKRKGLFNRLGEMKPDTARQHSTKKFGFTDDEAEKVFWGRSIYQTTHESQLKQLRKDINSVLKLRGLKTRV